MQNETNNYLKQSKKIVEIILNNYVNGLMEINKQISKEYEFKLSRIKNDDSTKIYLDSVFNSNSSNKLDFMFLSLFNGTVIDASLSVFDSSSIISNVISSQRSLFYKEILIDNNLIASIISREEIVDSQTGRHIGNLYTGIVLNDNFSLINEIYSLLDVKMVAFVANNKTIATYDFLDYERYNKFENIKRDKIIIVDNSIIKKSQVEIKGMDTALEVLIISSNNVYNKFGNEFLTKITFVMFFVILLFFITYKFIKKLIEAPLQKLLLFTSHTIKNKTVPEYEETLVSEFNKVGKDFKALISRITKMNHTLGDLVEKRTEELSIKSNKVASLLNNAGQGFLSINNNFLINDEYSRECENILGKDLENKDIIELLFEKKKKKVKFFKETILDALAETNDLTSNLLLSLLPPEIIIRKRAIKIEYKVLSDEKLMLILTNITDKKKLELKIKKEEETLKMIVLIVSDSVEFYEIKENYEQFCSDSELYIKDDETAVENANTLYIVIHTFKGLFAQLYMKNTVKELHDLESKLLGFIDDEDSNNTLLHKLISSYNLSSIMDQDLKLITNSLGEKFLFEQSHIKINEELMNKLEKKLSIFCDVSKEHQKECEEILLDIKKLKNRTLKYYLSVYPKICQHLSLSLNKNIYPFEIIGDNNIFVPDSFKPFINSLVHVFRNCCDHGIEKKEKRILLNKNEVGTISCIFKREGDLLNIEILDDGCGINIESIKEKIVHYKLSTKDSLDTLTQEEILNYIFDTHFSTKESTNEVSGRGVGLSAVKIELEKLNGKVEIDSEVNKGTSFMFKIPLIKV